MRFIGLFCTFCIVNNLLNIRSMGGWELFESKGLHFIGASMFNMGS